MKRYLDPKADVVFKKVFGEHPHILKSFLNAVLPLPDDQLIVSLEYLSSENTPSIPVLKKTIADVKCTDNQGRVFIVEMQIDWIDSFKQRLLFETGQVLVRQLDKGEDYHLLKPVYGLGLIATNFDTTEQWYHHYQLVNKDKVPREVIEHLQLVFIELKKFPVHSSQEKKLRLLWLRFMREINEKTENISEDLQGVPEIQEAIDLVEQSAYSEGELLAYQDYWNAVSTEKSQWEGHYRKGKAEGISQGISQGKTEGLIEGEAKGRHKERIGFAKRLWLRGADDELIFEYTQITRKELEKLKEEWKLTT